EGILLAFVTLVAAPPLPGVPGGSSKSSSVTGSGGPYTENEKPRTRVWDLLQPSGTGRGRPCVCQVQYALPSMSENTPPEVPVPAFRPGDRSSPSVDLPEQPTPEELASLHPELSEALFGRPKLPFSMSLEFSPFDEPGY